jgi:prepilin-type N-terminal cleavage/methylation domain-containing protein
MKWNHAVKTDIRDRCGAREAGDCRRTVMPFLRRQAAKERGMTLAELLVAAAVLALFLLITDRVFISVNLASRTTQRAIDMQQNARVAALRLRREIRESGGAAITCYPDPSCRTPSTEIVFTSARPSETASVFCLDVAAGDQGRRALESACSTPIPVTGTYAPVWQRYIGYHLDGEGGLRRVVENAPIALPMPRASGQVLAAHVVALAVSREGRRLRFHIESINRDTGGFGGSPTQEMELDDTVDLRNAIVISAG